MRRVDGCVTEPAGETAVAMLMKGLHETTKMVRADLLSNLELLTTLDRFSPNSVANYSRRFWPLNLEMNQSGSKDYNLIYTKTRLLINEIPPVMMPWLRN